MNRKQRRATAKLGAGSQILTTLEALQKIQGLGLEGTTHLLEDLGNRLSEARDTMESLVRTVSSLGFELEVQREVNLRLLSRLYANAELSEKQALTQLKELEAQVRKTLVEDLIAEQSAFPQEVPEDSGEG